MRSQKPAGYWDDIANVERELRAFMSTHGGNAIPTVTYLTKAGRRDLVHAIDKHGGFPAVGTLLGIIRPGARKPNGYWDDIATFERELHAFVATQGTDGTMPSLRELVAAGRN